MGFSEHRSYRDRNRKKYYKKKEQTYHFVQVDKYELRIIKCAFLGAIVLLWVMNFIITGKPF